MTLTTHTIFSFGYGGRIVAVYDDVTLEISEFRYRSPGRPLEISVNREAEETLAARQTDAPLSKPGYFMTKNVLRDEGEGRARTVIGFDGEIRAGWNR